jgi:hypothetical protein
MIIDVPQFSDFEGAGLSMLNLGWDAVAALYRDLENAQVDEWDDDGTVTEEYWDAAKHPTAVALALVQQGIELLLKAKIAEVSPFLLLAGSPRDWPSGCDRSDTPFADFRSIESHELLRAHDAAAGRRLGDRFKQEFETLRRLRNVVLHGIDKRLRPSGGDVFRTVLEAAEELLEPRGWMRRRRHYLESSPAAVAYGGDIDLMFVPEAVTLLDLLKPAEAKRYLGFDKKARAYICPTCARECSGAGLLPFTAQLRPNTPDSKTIYCFVCDTVITVQRMRCREADCKGNVLEEDVCLICYIDMSRRTV